MGKNIDLPDNDFGFSSVSREDLEPGQSNDKALEIYNLILPLLKNLAKDSDKNDYIHWPNRKKVIDEFMAKLQNILAS